MKYAATLAALFALAAPLAPLHAQRPGSKVTLSQCVVTLDDHVQVPAQDAGVLSEMLAKEGAAVEPDALVARLKDLESQVRKRAAELEYKVALAEAENNISIRYAQAAAKVAAATIEESEYVERRSPGSIPEPQLRRERLEHRRAELQIEAAQLEFKTAGLTADVRQVQVDAADMEIERRQIKSPLKGVVVDIYKQVGEWVQAGEAIMRIVRMDRLRVEGFLSSTEVSPVEVDGAPVEVTVRLAGGREATFTGKIEFVNPLVEASGEYRVWAAVENRMERGHWLLRPGVNAEMTITLNRNVAARTP